MRIVSTSIQINAPPQRVWGFLTDFPAHAAWNPFIHFISGALQAGAKLTVEIKLPSGTGMTFRPTVLVAEANNELRWKGKLLVPGIFDREHFFELRETPSGTRLHHGEKFSGIIVAMMRAEKSARLSDPAGAFDAASVRD